MKKWVVLLLVLAPVLAAAGDGGGGSTVGNGGGWRTVPDFKLNPRIKGYSVKGKSEKVDPITKKAAAKSKK